MKDMAKMDGWIHIPLKPKTTPKLRARSQHQRESSSKPYLSGMLSKVWQLPTEWANWQVVSTALYVSG